MLESSLYIGGNWVPASSGAILAVHSPATGQQVAQVSKGTRQDVASAVAAARQAQPQFARLTVFERSKLCHRIADVIHERREALARHMSVEQGKPYQAEALGEVDVAVKMFRMAAEDALRLEGATIPSEDARKRIFTIRQAR